MKCYRWDTTLVRYDILFFMLHFINYVVTTFGYIGLFGVVFLESAFPILFFLPGDSLLFTTGLLAFTGSLNVSVLIFTYATATILGYTLNYFVGEFVGPKIFSKEDSFWFNPKRLRQAHEFFERHGPKTILLARFVVGVRSFAPAIAGASDMKKRVFMFYNFMGGIIWSVIITSVGYFLGSKIPHLDKYITPIIFLIVLFSVIPVVLEYYKDKKRKSEIS